MPWGAVAGAVIGGGLSYLGSKKTADAQKDAAKSAANAANFSPYNVFMPSGSSTLFGKGLTREDLLGGGATGDFYSTSGGRGGLLSDKFVRHTPGEQQQSIADYINSFGAASREDASSMYAANRDALTSRYGDAAALATDPNTGALSGDILGQFLHSNAGTQQALDTMLGGSALNMFSRPNELASAGLIGSGVSGLGQAFNFLDPSRSYQDLAKDKLGLLRDTARPQEEKLVNSRIQNLFSTGRLGTTGGAGALGELQQSLDQADLQRQLAAQALAAQQQSSDRASAGVLGSLSGNALQSGRELQTADNLRNQIFGGMAQNLLQMRPELAESTLKARTGFSDATYSRAQQRLSDMQRLFNFNNQLPTAAVQPQQNMLSLLDSQAAASIGLGADLGKAGATAGANAGAFLNSAQPFNSYGALADIYNSANQNGAINNFFGNMFNSGDSGGGSGEQTVEFDPSRYY